jgi:hypothetical protein
MKKNIRSSVYVSVEIDPLDVLDELTETECETVARQWGYVPKNDGVREEVSHAINQIRAGNTEDAIVTLERTFLPTWKDVADCEQQYKLAMRRTA